MTKAMESKATNASVSGFQLLNKEEEGEPVVDTEIAATVKKPKVSALTAILAIDIGYGGTKVLTGSKELYFPSFVSTAISISATPIHKSTDLTIEINGAEYHYGERAVISDPRVARLTLDDREHDTAMQVLYHAALAEMYQDYEHVRLYIVSGLPNQSRVSTEEPLLNLLRGNASGEFLVHYKVGGVKRVLSVSVLNVRINTQPEGFYVNLMIDESLAKTTSKDDFKYFGVLDFGHYTFDYTLFSGAETVGLGGRYTNSFDGMYKAHEHLSKLLQEAFSKFRPHQSDVELALSTGKIKVRGEEQDVSEMVDVAIRTYARQAFEHILGRWEPILDKLDGIFIEGGGATPLAKLIGDHFSASANYKRTYVANDPTFNNVRGYHKLGRLLYGAEVSK